MSGTIRVRRPCAPKAPSATAISADAQPSPKNRRSIAPRAAPALSERERQLAELVDPVREPIAGLQPDLLVFRIARDHALRRAREDQIARAQREHLRRVRDQLPAVEDHVGGVGRLAYLAVDLRLER